MKRLLTTMIVLFLGIIPLGAALADEINGEVDISFVDPYKHFMPGFCASYRPQFLHWTRLSLGAGAAIHISSQFKYETTNAVGIPDSVNWYTFNESFAELTGFDFFGEARFLLSNPDPLAKTKFWLTLNGGCIINSANKTGFQTFFQQSGQTIVDLQKYVYYYPIFYRTDAYLSPGILFGSGNFIFGYRHWILFNNKNGELGRPAWMLGTLRVGYRFTW